MFKILDSPVLRQYIVVIIANLSVFSLGLNIAWVSPVLVKLRSNETCLLEPMTEEEGSWIVSIGMAAAIFCLLLPAYLLDRIGRKYTIILAILPRVPITLSYIFATEVWMLLPGRALSGICDVITFAAVPTFSSEIANKEVRGSLGTILQITCSVGIVTILSVGPFVSYITLNIIIIVLTILSSIPLLFLPDSPYFLYSKGNTDESLKVLKKLRGSENLAVEEIKEYEQASGNQKSVSIKILMKNRIFLKAIGILILLNAGSQLVGYSAIQFYLQTILESTQTSVRPEIASVIIGFIQLFASFCTNFVTDRFGRKPILSVTLVGMALGLFGLGTFFKIKEIHEVSGALNYLPLMSMIMVVFCYSAGLGSLIWLINSELFDGRTRAIGSSVAMIMAYLFFFVTSKFFASITLTIGAPATYWGFTVNCIFLCLFIIYCVPETKGRSFVEIQEILGGKLSSNI